MQGTGNNFERNKKLLEKLKSVSEYEGVAVSPTEYFMS